MDLFSSGRKVKMEKYLTEQVAFKQGKFEVKVGRRTEKGKTFNEYFIRAQGGLLKVLSQELSDLQTTLDKIIKLDKKTGSVFD